MWTYHHGPDPAIYRRRHHRCHRLVRDLPDSAWRTRSRRCRAKVRRSRPSVARRFEEQLGLNKSVPEQFGKWIGDIVSSGDFGSSVLTNRSIGSELVQRLLNTLHVGFATIIVGMVIGIPAGVLSAIKPNSLADRLVTMLSGRRRGDPRLSHRADPDPALRCDLGRAAGCRLRARLGRSGGIDPLVNHAHAGRGLGAFGDRGAADAFLDAGGDAPGLRAHGGEPRACASVA